MEKKIIVIGAGAAGLFAAGRAAECGADVVLLEKMALPGRKIGISGKGRCNLTNTSGLNDFLDHFGKNGRFLRQAIAEFSSQKLVSHLEQLGVPVKTERGGRVFPESDRATDVVKALEKWVRQSGVKLITKSTVTAIKNDTRHVLGVRTKGRDYRAGTVILTTGGASYSRTGSTGDGYILAAQCGHTITSIYPALIPLIVGNRSTAFPSGASLKNIRARLFVNGKKKKEEFGELRFNKTSLDGPVILTLSDIAVYNINQNKRVHIILDLKPALDENKLNNRLLRDIRAKSKSRVSNFLRGILPASLISFCCHENRLNPEMVAGKLTAKARKQLIHWLKNVRFEITGYEDLEKAIVTAGGVSLKEVDPITMQSRKIKGLYLAGELLDLHADTGGFNLQAAFSTGWMAGQSAAQQIEK